MIPAQTKTYNAAADLIERNLTECRAAKVAYVDQSGKYTYAELAERAGRCANALRETGLERGHRVVLCLLDSIDFPTCFLGAIKAGIVPIPLSTRSTATDFAAILADCLPHAAIVSQEVMPVFEEATRLAKWNGNTYPSGDNGQASSAYGARGSLASASPDAPTAATGPDDACFWLYSSGSTGNPKGVIHRQRSLLKTAELYGQGVLRITEQDVVFSAAKLFFAYGLGNALTFPMSVGAMTVLCSERPTPAIVNAILREHRPTIFFGVPTLFNAMLACSDLPRKGEHALRFCVSAGEALPEKIGLAWRERTGVDIVDGIGSTELLHIFLSNRPGAVRYGTTGRVVPGYRVRLMDENGSEPSPGEIGELQVSGPTVAAVSWHSKEKFPERYSEDWVHTGDRFKRTPEGDYVHCGRSDDILKVGGIYVSPLEVEGALLAHEAVLEAAVVGAPDEMGLVKPKAFVVLRHGVAGSPALVQTLQQFVKARLAPYKYPRWIEVIPALPKTATGKIRRHALRQGGMTRPGKMVEERNEITVDGKRLETLLIAPAGSDRASIVLLHEGLGSIAMWKDFPFRLAERTGYRVFAYSRYGHGHSERLTAKRDVSYMHHEGEVVLPALLEQVGIQRPVLLGHSDGGSIAIIFAGKYPTAARALILEAPHVFVEELSVESIGRAKVMYETTDLPRRLGRYHAHVDDTFSGWNDIWLDPRFRSWNIEAYLYSIQCPVLVIQGHEDEYGTNRQVEAIAHRVGATQTLLLPQCGHSPHRDHPEAVLGRIETFLAALC